MQKFVEKYLHTYRSQQMEILDIGSQDVNGTYKPLFTCDNWNYTGLDVVEGKNVDIVIEDMYNWKNIRSNKYDAVISGSALEHIEYFWLTFQEVARVLKPGAMCCFVVPSSGPEHKYPVDCWRFFPDGMEALSRYAGLKVLESYICWDQPDFDGEKNVWKDTVLICKK